MKTIVDISRHRRINNTTGKVRDKFFLFVDEEGSTCCGARVHLGGRQNLLHLKRKIDKYLSEEK
ncbi:MAG TPA: hypothetical protein DEQ30_05010 [Porphyromonadaceae bacterium]|nr:hypothetical protein [Porphyromonadaceae bacterium]